MRTIRLEESDLKRIISRVITEVIGKRLVFDINSISEKDARQQFINFKIVAIPDHYGSPFLKDKQGKYIIDEIIESLPLSEVKGLIAKKYSLQDWQFKIVTNANKIEIALIIPNIDTNKDMLEDDMLQLGYFSGIALPFKLHNMDWIQLQFEPLYQNDETNDLKNKGVLYHITPKYNIDSIKKNGILPKSENNLFNYPNRIYLVKSDITATQMEHLVKQLCQHNTNPLNNGEYCILKINTRKLPETVKLYLDPNYEMGCWTSDEIPPNCIENILTMTAK